MILSALFVPRFTVCLKTLARLSSWSILTCGRYAPRFAKALPPAPMSHTLQLHGFQDLSKLEDAAILLFSLCRVKEPGTDALWKHRGGLPTRDLHLDVLEKGLG